MDSTTDETESTTHIVMQTQDGSPGQVDSAEGSDVTPETEGNDEGESGEGKKVSMKDREVKLAQLRKRFVSSFHNSSIIETKACSSKHFGSFFLIA
jgi:pre-mRNA-splicing factor SYF2